VTYAREVKLEVEEGRIVVLKIMQIF